MTEIRLLGPPTLIKAGSPVRLHSAKTLALLAYLALEVHTIHSREKLAGLLWGESTESRARQSLRQALYSLRRVLGNDAFILEGGSVHFEPLPRLWLDASEFQSRVESDENGERLQTLRGAADLYRGMLLEGSEPADCPIFDEWLFFQRDGLEQQMMGVLQELVDGLLNHGDLQDALVYGQRLVALDPLHEGAHRRLMRTYSAMGDRDGVRRQFRQCTDLLEREFGAAPAGGTEALYHQLITVQPILPEYRDPSERPPSGQNRVTVPFVGREEEMEVLGEQFELAMRGQGRLVLVAGEEGVGKSRLVKEFMSRCAGRTEQPVCYVVGRCYAPESRAPYTMWADALQALSGPEWKAHLADLTPVWREQLARLVPDLGPPAGDIEGTTPAESRLRLLQGIVQTLVHLSRACGLCLWFDDLHWADEASLELLHYVSRHSAEYPLFIIGTYRPDAALDNQTLEQLLKEDRFLRLVPLASLEPDTVRLMVRSLDVMGSQGLADRLYQHSGGNPLFLVETLNTLSESGGLGDKVDGSLDALQVETWPVPQRIQELIQARLASLDEEQRRAMAAAAVIARPFGLLLLRRVSGLPELQAVHVVEEALTLGFLEERTGGPAWQELAFHHPYFQRVTYDGLSTVQRRALHRRTARALLEIYRSRPQIVTEEVAYHFEQAGDPGAVEYLTNAAQQAANLYAYQHATELYGRAVVVLGEQQPGDLQGRFDLIMEREAMLDRQGRRTEQGADVAELARLAEVMGDSSKKAMANICRAGFLAYSGQYVQARRAGERALDLYRAADDRIGEAQALRELGFLSWRAEDYGAALSYVRDALKLHRRLGDVEGEATALHNLAEIHRSLGSPRQAVAQYEAALNLYWAQQDRQRQALTLYGMAHALRQLGDLDGAESRYQQALAQCEAAGDRLMASRVHHALAGSYWECGATDRVPDHLEKAVEISREIGYGPGIAHGLVILSDLQAQDGDLEAAQHYIVEAITWLDLAEDEQGLVQARARLRAWQQGLPGETPFPSTEVGWVKSHVALAEGKVYCTFESPLAQE